MTIYADNINWKDVEQLALLHVSELPNSLISRVGEAFARAFYRYVARSKYELLFLCRNDIGTVVAALVLSFDPVSIEKRLLLHTPLLFWAALRPWRLPTRYMLGEWWSGCSSAQTTGTPEIIVLFTDRACRRQRLGFNLIEFCETALADRKMSSYIVKTENGSDNDALIFYSRKGFRRLLQGTRIYGKNFAIFEKTVRPAKFFSTPGRPADGLRSFEM